MKITQNKGFTLVEIIVSLAVFSIVAVVALGALLKIVDTNKKAQTLEASLTNLDYALESMSRELRVGSVYHCESTWTDSTFSAADMKVKACSNPGQNQMIVFTSSKVIATIVPCSPYIAYRFTTNDPDYSGKLVLEKAEQTECADDNLGDSQSPFVPVISPDNVTIDPTYEMSVTFDPATHPFPLAYIRISGYAGSKELEKSYFDVQTAVSARIP